MNWAVVGGADERERVEVELVAEGDASPFSRAATVGGRVDDGRPPNRRAIVTAVVVGVVALGLGWTLGRSGEDRMADPPAGTVPTLDEASDPVETIATAPPTPTTTPPGDDDGDIDTGGDDDDDGDDAPGGDGPGGDAGGGAGPNAVRTVVETEVDIVYGLQSQPIELVAYGNGRQLFELDLSTSTLRAREVTTQPFGRTRLLVAPDWALFPSSDPNFPSTLVPRSGNEREVEIGAAWQIVGVADEGSVWTLVPSPNPRGETVVQRTTVTGESTADLAFVPTPPIGVDPAGGVIIEIPGATVGVVPQTSRRVENTGASQVLDPVITPITTGRLIALGSDLAVAEECTPLLSCVQVVIDRSSGDRRVLVVPAAGSGGLAPYAYTGSWSIASDGSKAVVEVLDPFDRASSQRTIGVLDLATGVVTEIGPAQAVDEAVWTPDSRYVLFVEGGRVVAHDTVTGETEVVLDDLVAINAFAVRPIER